MRFEDREIVLKDGRIDKKGPREEILPQLIGTSSMVSYCRQDI